MQVSTTHLARSWFASAAAPSPSVSMYLSDNSCTSNCSGHGDCYNGTCFCEVEYSGGTCQDPNFKFYVSFSTVYYMICVVSFIQLMLCINSEIARQKHRSILRAFRISTQKALYFFICLGTAIRGFYFSSPANTHIRWAESLMSAYYPILMSGCGLVVCFWAEVFHLDMSLQRSRFLSKSFTGFVIFNVVTYSLLLAEMVFFVFTDPNDADKSTLLMVFNSIYAALMFIVVVAFLVYGVEVYFKVRGAFTHGALSPVASTSAGSASPPCDLSNADISQLQQSRLGLISQAVLLLITILFLISEVLGSMWKDKVPVLSRNYHQVMFRVVEFGVALWFPCVLWNCIEPEKLWILNPRKILKKGAIANSLYQIEGHRRPSKLLISSGGGKSVAESERLVGGVASSVPVTNVPECWICYESVESKPEAGPLMQPCACRGDVSAVHHQCLIRWLMEAYRAPTCPVQCKVCGTPYRVEQTSEFVCLPAGLSISHWMKTAAILTIMAITLAGSCLLVKTFSHMYVKTISVGAAILAEYICLRLLGFNLIAAYHRAKFSAIKIIGRKVTTSTSTAVTTQPSSSSPEKDNSGDCEGLPRSQVLACCSTTYTTAHHHASEDSGIGIGGTSSARKAHLHQGLLCERAEVHHSCSSPDFSEDEDCCSNCATPAHAHSPSSSSSTSPGLPSLSERIPAEHLCSSVTCEHSLQEQHP